MKDEDLAFKDICMEFFFLGVETAQVGERDLEGEFDRFWEQFNSDKGD